MERAISIATNGMPNYGPGVTTVRMAPTKRLRNRIATLRVTKSRIGSTSLPMRRRTSLERILSRPGMPTTFFERSDAAMAPKV